YGIVIDIIKRIFHSCNTSVEIVVNPLIQGSEVLFGIGFVVVHYPESNGINAFLYVDFGLAVHTHPSTGIGKGPLDPDDHQTLVEPWLENQLVVLPDTHFFLLKGAGKD